MKKYEHLAAFVLIAISTALKLGSIIALCTIHAHQNELLPVYKTVHVDQHELCHEYKVKHKIINKKSKRSIPKHGNVQLLLLTA